MDRSDRWRRPFRERAEATSTALDIASRCIAECRSCLGCSGLSPEKSRAGRAKLSSEELVREVAQQVSMRSSAAPPRCEQRRPLEKKPRKREFFHQGLA